MQFIETFKVDQYIDTEKAFYASANDRQRKYYVLGPSVGPAVHQHLFCIRQYLYLAEAFQ